MKNHNFRQYFLLLVFTFEIISLNAQFTSVSGFNYYDINHNSFTVDASCLDIDAQAERELGYYFTALHLAEQVEEVFNDNSQNERVVGDYLIKRDYYVNKTLGGEDLQWIMIRPNDEIVRPVIVLTHGGKSGDAVPERTMPLGMFDYVQRGYAVVYYQSGSSVFGDGDQAIIDAGVDPTCIMSNGIDSDLDCFQQAVYIKMLFGIAAVQYTVAKKEEYHLESDALFISGFSGGGVGSLYTALAKEGDHFTDEIFSGLGDFTSLSKFATQEYDIKAVTSLAGGLIHETYTDYKVGEDVIDASDQSKRFLLFHGQDDTAVQPGIAPLQWLDPGQELIGSKMSCALTLKDDLDEVGVENKVIINCSAGHSMFSYPCHYNDDDFGNNPDFIIGAPAICMGWALHENFSGYNFESLCDPSNTRVHFDEFLYVMMQIHDYAKLSSYFLHEDFSESGPERQEDVFIDEVFSNNDISTVLPMDFPYQENTAELQNGHWSKSDRCQQEECTALYFNKFGTGNSILLFGDFVQLGGSELNVFNDDFTIELKFRAIDHEGIGILFSHMDNIGQGFEVFINAQGFIQFKKSVNGNASIIGDENLLDGKCHYLVVARDGNEFSVYVDGNLQGDTKTFNINFPNSNKVRIGNTSLELQTGNNGFNGAIQHVNLWTKILDFEDFEIRNWPTETEGLLAEFSFDMGYGQVINSTNGNFAGLLGNTLNNLNYDPRWMSDDIYCTFMESCIISNENTELAPSSFSVYPNPSTGRVFIEHQVDDLEPTMVFVYDIQGKQVISANYQPAGTAINISVSGMYIVELRSEHYCMHQKIVID